MEKMGAYCKAYPINRLRQFSGWTEKAENTRKVQTQVDGVEVAAPRELTEDDFLYVQEDYTVTDGIFLEQNVVFNDVTPEWVDFCTTVLKFEIPDYQQAASVMQASADLAATSQHNGAGAAD